MNVKAAIASGPAQPLRVETVDLEGPRPGEVLVEIKAAGVCHTDAVTLWGQNPAALFPAVLGHEGAGVVVDIGAGVTSVCPGDHVIPLYVPECRQCRHCLSGRTNLCWAIRATRDRGVMPDGTSRFSLKGQTVYHFMGTSTFANYTVLPEIAVAPIRRDAPFDKSCFVGCGVATGLGAVFNTAKVRPGDKVVVLGLGGVGLNVIQGARMANADMVIGVDRNPRKRPLAERLGMTEFVDPREIGAELVDYLVARTGGGADVAFDCTGDVTVMRQALECCHVGWGTCVILGVEDAGAVVSASPKLIRYGRTWTGSVFGGVRGRTELPRFVDWYMQGKIVIDDLITHLLPIEEINTAFDLMRRGDSIRSVVTF